MDNKILCPDCKTGAESYLIDKHSTECPYILCCKGSTCAHYVPINEEKKIPLWKKACNLLLHR